MPRDRHFVPMLRKATRELLLDPRRKGPEAGYVQARVEWCYGPTPPESNRELDAIELLLGPDFKTFTK